MPLASVVIAAPPPAQSVQPAPTAGAAATTEPPQLSQPLETAGVEQQLERRRRCLQPRLRPQQLLDCSQQEGSAGAQQGSGAGSGAQHGSGAGAGAQHGSATGAGAQHGSATGAGAQQLAAL